MKFKRDVETLILNGPYFMKSLPGRIFPCNSQEAGGKLIFQFSI